MNIQQLVERCLQQDRKAQKELVVQFGGYLMTICRRYIHDAHYCEDVCQNAFINVFRKLHQYDASRGALRSWMCKITIHCALEFLRSKHFKFDELDKTIEPISTGEVPLGHLYQEDLLKMLHSLNVMQRTIFNLHEIEGYAHAEIATMLNLKESTCRSHLHRAKKILSLKLQALRDEAI